jgi:hypothetical protein
MLAGIRKVLLKGSLRPPLDGTTATLTGAWSMSRTLRSAYSGSLFTDVSGAVSVLLDQSGNARNFDQGTAGARPTLAYGGLQQRRCAAFDGTDDFLISTGTGTSTFVTASAGYVIATGIVDTFATDVAPSLVRTNDMLWGNQDRLLGMCFRSTGPNAYAWNWDGNEDSTSTGNPVTSGAAYVFEWRHDTGVVYLRVNGRTETSGTSGNSTEVEFANPLKIGGEAVTPNYSNIRFFEMAAFSTVPPLAERDALVANMHSWVNG